jgi:SAM-dependent methyltransferase
MRPDALLPKPAHLGPAYGAQFQDECVARAYAARPPYPSAFFDALERLQPPGPRAVLELGSGTGDVTLELAPRVGRIDAVEPSPAMLAAARRRPRADHPSIRWIAATAEAAPFDGPYSLAVAAESLHWMEWHVVLPRVAAALAPGAFLVLADRGTSGPLAWDAELGRLISEYSTNREFKPYDLAAELASRGLFREVGRHTTPPASFSQSVDNYILSLHSRNGFSRDRMGPDAAMQFDTRVRQLLRRHCRHDEVRLPTVATIIWGVPAPAPPPPT